MGCSRIILFLLNFVVFAAGVAAVGFALYTVFAIAFDENDIGDMLGGKNLMIVAGVFAAIAGFVILISFLGCCGAYKEMSFVVVLYIIMLTVLVVIECAIVGVFVFYGADVEDKTEEWLGDSMKEYDSDSDVKLAWDKFQRKFDCCGVKNWTEWAEILSSPPDSCCKDDAAVGSCPNDDYYTKGCLAKVVDEIEDKMDILMYAGIGVLVVQVLCLLLGCCAVNSFRKEIKYA